MLSARLVGASLDGFLGSLARPGGGGELDGYASVLVQLQKAPGRVIDVVECGEVAAGAAFADEGGPALTSQQLNVSAN